MAKRQLVIEIPALGAIDRSKGRIGQQLAASLRRAISTGELKGGERLPSTRALADSMDLSRGTVTEAYEQLRAEGLLETQASGSRQGGYLCARTLTHVLGKSAAFRPHARIRRLYQNTVAWRSKKTGASFEAEQQTVTT
ncbi:GntR family transcriptional regulator [Advenella sp. RU8]|uniref:GntR family transcriptional regulator n=1 Tax=Advenella sp. RU8 TaxID=3399575 RepID=UPI003AAC3DA9